VENVVRKIDDAQMKDKKNYGMGKMKKIL